MSVLKGTFCYLLLLHEITGLSPCTTSSSKYKQALMTGEHCPVPIEDKWRIPYLRSLVGQRRVAKDLVLDDLDGYLSELIHSLVIN